MIHAKLPTDSTVKQAPWLVGEQRYSRINDQDQIAQILKETRDHNLLMTIAVPDGPDTLFYDSFLLDIKKDRIRIYRPARWPKKNSEEFFRVFFRNNGGHWYSLKAVLIHQDSHSISIRTPKTLYALHHRDHNRLNLPPEAKLSFTWNNNPTTTFQIVNISKTGMLIRSCDENFTLPVFSRLNNISIDLPGANAENLPTIEQAQVVRSFRTDKDNLLYYGILFKKDCVAGEKIIWSMISQDTTADTAIRQ